MIWYHISCNITVTICGAIMEKPRKTAQGGDLDPDGESTGHRSLTEAKVLGNSLEITL